MGRGDAVSSLCRLWKVDEPVGDSSEHSGACLKAAPEGACGS